MTRRRLRAVPALTGIALLLALPFSAPAGAAGGLDVAITSPGQGEKRTTPGVTVSGTVTAKALLATVTYVEVNFFNNGTRFHTEVVCSGCGNETAVPFSVDSPVLDLNGPYSVEVRATGRIILDGLGADGSASRSFVVAVPPGPPTAVSATPQPDRSVKLSWTAPAVTRDFLGYAIYRKTGTQPFAVLAVTKQTTYTDTATAQLQGAVQYIVASVREGAVPGDTSTALQTSSAAVVATLPPLPTTSTVPVPGVTTTTLPPGGGNQEGGAASVDLSDLLPSRTTPPPTFPPPPPPPTLPDTGFSANLPFPSTSLGALDPSKVEGRQPGNVGSTSGAGQLQATSEEDDANRRALLVPVAAGSVLCVTALHLRWLNRRVAASAALAKAGGPGPFGPDDTIADLDPLPPEPPTGPGQPPDAGAFLPDAEPVGVGAGPTR